MDDVSRKHIKTIEVRIPLTCEVGTEVHTLETALNRIAHMQQVHGMYTALRVIGSCTDSRGIKTLVVNFLVYGRRDFANVMYIMNWALSHKYELAIVTHEKRAEYKNSAEFWRLLALAQMWYRSDAYDELY